MITEDYVSFVTAKLLNEKGFDGFCTRYYQSDKEDVNGEHALFMFASDLKSFCTVTNDLLNKYADKSCENFSAPTLQMAMKWLRKVHDIAIDTEWAHLWYASIKPMTAAPFEDYHCISSKYEEACETAIRYCLENLI